MIGALDSVADRGGGDCERRRREGGEAVRSRGLGERDLLEVNTNLSSYGQVSLTSSV